MEQTSKYEPVAEKLEELGGEAGIVISDLGETEAEELRAFLYRRFGEETLRLRIQKQEDGTFEAVIFPKGW